MSFEENQEPEEELPDWLKDLNEDSKDQAEDEGKLSNSETTDVSEDTGFKTDEDFGGATNKKAAEYLQGDFEEDDTEDWLNSIREQQAILSEDEEPEEEKEEPGDFIERIRGFKKEEAEIEEADPQTWLDDLATDEKSEDENAEFLDTSEIEEGLDWMSGIADEKTTPLTSELVEDRLEALDEEEGRNVDMPDWLKKIQNGSDNLEDEQTTNDEEESEETEEPGKTGDWIKKYTGTLDPSVLDENPEFKLEEDLAWINEQDVAAEETGELAVESGEEQETEDSQDPSWLSGMEESSLAEAEIEMPAYNIEEILADDSDEKEFKLEEFELETDAIPDWLETAESRIDGTEDGTKPPPLGDEEAIAPANIPTWLQAMRPEGAEDLFEYEGSQTPETTGPLAGLENILPAESANILFGSQHVPRVDLYISKTQQSHISILQKMLTEEEEANPVKRRTLAIPQQIFRWLIAGLLYLAVLIPVFTFQSITPLPSAAQPQITAMAEIINGLPPNAPVLVAFEYQPGLSGEMEAASAAVLDHLLIRGAQPAFISTSPTGPGLIMHYLDTLLSEHTFIANREYPNLGFISGGTAALLNFATAPQNSIPMVNITDLEGKVVDAWGVAPLKDIKEISDFAMILVITDDPDTARSWIEQVQPLLINETSPEESTPLTMIISAQAEPLVYPYFDISPRQVSGYVSGLSGGATYESISVRENVASRYWDAFSSGISITILVIIVGGIFNLFIGWKGSRKKVQ